jgi:hypothetical protein
MARLYLLLFVNVSTFAICNYISFPCLIFCILQSMIAYCFRLNQYKERPLYLESILICYVRGSFTTKAQQHTNTPGLQKLHELYVAVSWEIKTRTGHLVLYVSHVQEGYGIGWTKENVNAFRYTCGLAGSKELCRWLLFFCVSVTGFSGKIIIKFSTQT